MIRGILADLAESGNSVTTMKLLEIGVEVSSLLSKILASTVLLQQIHGSGYFSLPDSLLLIQAEVSVSQPFLKINHSARWKSARPDLDHPVIESRSEVNA